MSRLTQLDVSGLSENDLRLTVIALARAADDLPPAARTLVRRLAGEVGRVRRGRHQVLGELELDFLNDPDAEGALVEPGSDPIGDALRELRGETP